MIKFKDFLKEAEDYKKNDRLTIVSSFKATSTGKNTPDWFVTDMLVWFEYEDDGMIYFKSAPFEYGSTVLWKVDAETFKKSTVTDAELNQRFLNDLKDD